MSNLPKRAPDTILTAAPVADLTRPLVAAVQVQQAPPQNTRGRHPLSQAKTPTIRLGMDHKPRATEAIPSDVRKEMRRLAEGKSPWPWFVWGGVGVGKTCAALCLHDFAGGEFYTADEWAEMLNQARDGQLTLKVMGEGCGVWGEARPREMKVYPDALWRLAKSAPLFVIDELGARSQISDHQYCAVKRLLDLREGKPTVAISNLDLDEISRRYGEPVASRLAAGTVTHFDGNDRRLKR